MSEKMSEHMTTSYRKILTSSVCNIVVIGICSSWCDFSYLSTT